MASNDYINPFSANDPSNFGEGKTAWEMFYGAQKVRDAQPFMDMARQRQQMGLQQQGQELSEFMSPEAQKARMSGFGATSAKNQQTIELTPQETLQKLQESKDKLRSSGILTDEKMAKADAFLKTHKVQHLTDFTAGLAGIGERLEQLPSNMPKEMKDAYAKNLYKSFVNDWQMKHPDKQLPPHLQEFDQDTPNQIAVAQYMDIESRKNAAQMRIEQMKEASAEKRTGMTAQATRDAAGISAKQSGENAALVYGTRQDQASNARAAHIQKAVSDAMGSVAYIQAQGPEAKQKILDDAEQRAVGIYNKYGMGTGQGQPQLPPGIPKGSKKIGKTPQGKDVWQAPNGTKYAP